MVKYFLLIGVLFTIAGCGAPAHSDAEALCNCYKEVHKVPADNLPIVEFVMDSCNTMFKNTLDGLENEKEKKAFYEAYHYCQDQQ